MCVNIPTDIKPYGRCTHCVQRFSRIVQVHSRLQSFTDQSRPLLTAFAGLVEIPEELNPIQTGVHTALCERHPDIDINLVPGCADPHSKDVCFPFPSCFRQFRSQSTSTKHSYFALVSNLTAQ